MVDMSLEKSPRNKPLSSKKNGILKRILNTIVSSSIKFEGKHGP